MASLSDLKILTKCLILLSSLAALIVAELVFSTGRMHFIHSTYSQLIDGLVEGSIEIAHADKQATLAISFIGDLLMSTTDEGNKKATSGISTSMESFTKDISAGAKAMPERRQALESLIAEMHHIVDSSCRDAITMGASSTTSEGNAKAQAEFLRNCQPMLEPLTQHLRTIVDDIAADMKRDNDSATITTDSTIQITYIVTLIGLALSMGVIIFFTSRSVVMPITTLASALDELSRNNLNANVTVSQRKDEIGVMAKAFFGLRESLIHARNLESRQQELKSQAERDRKAALLEMADAFEVQ